MSSTHAETKVALITGGAGGIGSEIARRLAANGINVAVAYSKSEQAAQQLVGEIQASKGSAHAFKADVAQPSAVEPLFQAVIEKFGRVDYVINNAGTIIPGPIADITENFYDHVFGVNVRGALFVLKAAAKHLKDGGSIVNTSSTLVTAPIAGSALYTASKAALEAFSEVLSKEVGARGITVNAIRVGPVIPGMFVKAPPERKAALTAASPFKRLGTPKDVASVVAFLVSEEARWITGQVITVDGGST